MKKSRVKTEFLKFRFKGEVKRDERDHNLRLGSQCINRVGKFESLGSVVKGNGGIVEDLVSRNKK